MPRYALVDNATHVVFNVVNWDGDSKGWTPPATITPVQTDKGNIGDTYDGIGFATPAPPALTAEQVTFNQSVALLRNTFNNPRTVGQVNNCIDAITVILRRIVSDLS